MPRKAPPPTDEKPQHDRFIETAREVGASEDPEEFERVFRRVVKPQAPVVPAPQKPDSTGGR